ncbi:MAG: pilus assembly protein [Gemmataceae bacterium]|nr:pilus assembly protein [Gemmataceae bacterium]
MMQRRTAFRRRAGVATVEAAVVLALLLVPVIIGVWEVGRLVYAQQVITNAAREGARLAAQGRVVNRLGTPTEIAFNSGTPNVADTVYQAIVTGGLSGLTRADVTIRFGFEGETPSANPSKLPYQGLKNERFRVFVSVPWDKVKWVNLGLVNPTTVEYTVDWQMLVDDTFTINVDLPKW